MKKLIYIFVAVAVVGFLGAVGASAQVKGNQSFVIQKLAEKFNLKADDIQKVFDEVQQQRQQEMQQKMETQYKEKLDKMVADGKLTQAQEDAILAKREELEKKYEELKGLALTVDERNAKMKEIQDELKKWAEDNGIDLKLVNMFGMGFGGMRGGFMGGGFGGKVRGNHSFGPRW